MASRRHPHSQPPKGRKPGPLGPRDPPGKASLTGGDLAEAPRSCHPRRPRRGLRILGRCDDPMGEAAPLPIALRDPRPLRFPLGPPHSLPMAAAQDTRQGPATSQLLSLSSSRLWPKRQEAWDTLSPSPQGSAHESCDTRSQLLPDPPPDLAPTVGLRPPRCHGHRGRGDRGGAARQEAGLPAIVGVSWLSCSIPVLP